MAVIKDTVRYIRAAPWPYLTGGTSLLLAVSLKAVGVLSWAEGDLTEAAVFVSWGAGWLVVAFFALADGVSRHREYRRIKMMLLKYGFSERIFLPLARSRCQRDAALHAARETGHLERARAYFKGLGYRWYHILPDVVLRNPFAFVNPSFLRSSFMPGKKARG